MEGQLAVRHAEHAKLRCHHSLLVLLLEELSLLRRVAASELLEHL